MAIQHEGEPRARLRDEAEIEEPPVESMHWSVPGSEREGGGVGHLEHSVDVREDESREEIERNRTLDASDRDPAVGEDLPQQSRGE